MVTVFISFTRMLRLHSNYIHFASFALKKLQTMEMTLFLFTLASQPRCFLVSAKQSCRWIEKLYNNIDEKWIFRLKQLAKRKWSCRLIVTTAHKKKKSWDIFLLYFLQKYLTHFSNSYKKHTIFQCDWCRFSTFF